jgi:hypothetical protein
MVHDSTIPSVVHTVEDTLFFMRWKGWIIPQIALLLLCHFHVFKPLKKVPRGQVGQVCLGRCGSSSSHPDSSLSQGSINWFISGMPTSVSMRTTLNDLCFFAQNNPRMGFLWTSIIDWVKCVQKGHVSESESELLYSWQFTANQFIFATSPLRLMTSNFIFQLNTCSYSPYVTSSLMRGWVCHLQLLLVVASTDILRSESRGTHDHILLSQIWDSSNLGARSPYLYPPGTGWPSCTPRH